MTQSDWAAARRVLSKQAYANLRRAHRQARIHRLRRWFTDPAFEDVWRLRIRIAATTSNLAVLGLVPQSMAAARRDQLKRLRRVDLYSVRLSRRFRVEERARRGAKLRRRVRSLRDRLPFPKYQSQDADTRTTPVAADVSSPGVVGRPTNEPRNATRQARGKPSLEELRQEQEQRTRGYARRAETGDMHAQFNLGKELGGKHTLDGFRDWDGPDPHQAALWYRKAADQGHLEAPIELGNLFSRSNSLGPDPSTGLDWYLIAARRAGKLPQWTAEWLLTRIGDMYREGEGTPRNPREAAGWYRRAVQLQDSRAMFKLATMQEAGEGVARDAQEALKLYRAASAWNHAGAQFRLAEMSREGIGMDRDLVEARKWFGLVAGMGQRHSRGDEAEKERATAEYERLSVELTAEQVSASDQAIASWTPRSDREKYV